MKFAKIVLCMLMLFSLLVFSGCGHKGQTTDDIAPADQTQQTDNAVQTDEAYVGTVRGRYETNMSFQVGGKIVACNVRPGTPVRAGDVLMVLDDRGMMPQENQGDAQVASAKERLTAAQANLKQYAKLYQEEAIPKETLDQYQANYDTAFAAYQNALAQAAQSHDVFGYTNLTAGTNGTVTSIQAEIGRDVVAGQTVLTLTQTNELEVEIEVPKELVNAIHVGMKAKVDFTELSVQTDGVVRDVLPLTDASAQTYRVRISIPQPPDGMQPGMTASVNFGQ